MGLIHYSQMDKMYERNENFFKLDALGKRKQNGSSNHVPSRNRFHEEKWNNFVGRRGRTSLGERGLSYFGERHDLKILIPNFCFCIIKDARAFQYVHFEHFHKKCLIWTKFYSYKFLSNIQKLAP
jgi:hypothetical protein